MATAQARSLSQMEVVRTEATHLADVAVTIRDDALEQAREGMGPLAKRLDQHALFGRAEFVERFRYGMAKAAALSIAANDTRVEAVYLFDAESNPEPGDSSIVDSVSLLAVVSSPTAALESFISSLDRSLAHSLKDLNPQLFKQRESILDVKLITREDIANKTGYAVLLGSIHAPALRIWQRTGK